MRVVYVVAFFMLAGEFVSGNQATDLQLEDHVRVDLDDRSDRGNELLLNRSKKQKNHFY